MPACHVAKCVPNLRENLRARAMISRTAGILRFFNVLLSLLFLGLLNCKLLCVYEYVIYEEVRERFKIREIFFFYIASIKREIF